ncbi:MAG: hypothetical protein CM15mP21_5560 [Hyphomicrobiales bacterium]|nr:MAG: hypothetical protein CM15mP21_5560 [Hyphomicrobiales bacterium]
MAIYWLRICGGAFPAVDRPLPRVLRNRGCRVSCVRRRNENPLCPSPTGHLQVCSVKCSTLARSSALKIGSGKDLILNLVQSVSRKRARPDAEHWG